MPVRDLAFVVCLLATMPFASPSGAQLDPAVDEPSGPLTLAQALELALTKSPEVSAAELDLVAVEARRLQAGLRSNPEAGMEVENLSGDLPGASEAEITLSLSQRLELGGKRSARVALAESLGALARWDIEGQRRLVVRELETAFAAGLGAQERLAVAEETLALALEVATSVDQKVRAGAISPVETTRARIAVARAEVELATVRREVDLTRRLLGLRWGSASPRFTSLAGQLDTLPSLPVWSDLLASLDRHPEVARWETELGARSARLRMQRSLAVPDLSLTGGIRRLEESDRTTFVVGFDLPLPFFDRNQGAVREAAIDLDKGAREQLIARRRMERDLLAALTRLEIAQASIRGLRLAVIPGAESTFGEIRRGYEMGKFSYLDVLEARRSLAEARGAEIEALVILAQTRAEAKSLVGESL
jgi:cobalt-zinc-cadmium efflux system outer membrane protein